MNDPAIVVKQLSFRYPESGRRVLRDIDLEVRAGETVLVLGPSGSGKSTLALCLNGLIPHVVEGEMRGEVRIWGRPTTELPAGRLCQQVGILFQDPETQLVMPRVREEVAFGLENLGIAPDAMPGRIGGALAQVGLAGRDAERVETLSGGQQQRLALAALLAMRPAILVLDEPTAHLDPAGAAAFFQTLRALQAQGGMTVVLIEHRLDMALPLVDRAVVLTKEGRVLVAGTPREVFSTQTAALDQAGIWLPTGCRLTATLRSHGVPVEGCPLTLDEAEGVLRPLLERTAAAGPAGMAEVEVAGRSVDRPAIAVERLSFAYAGAPPALQDINLRVERGTFFALVGANGSGKTTLAKVLTGLLRPSRGAVRILGDEQRPRRSGRALQRVGYVFQNPEHQFVTERVVDELAYSLPARWGEEQARRRTRDLLRSFRLEGYEEVNPFALSQGQKRRLSVATMVALEQPILILDEPTFGQDHQSTTALMSSLRALQASGTTIVMITHDMQLVADYAEEVAVLRAGSLCFQGKPGDLFRQPELLRQTGLTLPPLADLGRRLGQPNLHTSSALLSFIRAQAGSKTRPVHVRYAPD